MYSRISDRIKLRMHTINPRAALKINMRYTHSVNNTTNVDSKSTKEFKWKHKKILIKL